MESGAARQYPVLGVGGVIIREGRALLIRRGKSPLEGRWSIPGGRVEWGETIEQALLRELREETGLEARVLELVEIVEPVFDEAPEGSLPTAAPEGEPPQFHFVILDYYCEAPAGAAHAGGDAAAVAWAGEEELARFDLTVAALRVIRRAFAISRARAV